MDNFLHIQEGSRLKTLPIILTFLIILSGLAAGGMLGVHPAKAISPNSAKAVLRCQGLLPPTPDCNDTHLTPFETVVYDKGQNGVSTPLDPIIVGPTLPNGTALKYDPKIMYQDNGNHAHWTPGDPVFYNTNNTVAGRVFLSGPPTVRTGPTFIKNDPLIKFADINGNGVLDGVVAVTVQLQDLGGVLPGGDQQDVGAVQAVYTFNPNLLQVMCTQILCDSPGSSVLSGQFDAWCIANPVGCSSPSAGKFMYLVDDYCSRASGVNLGDIVKPDNLLGKISASSSCASTTNFDYGIGCDPALNPTICVGDFTNATSPGTAPLSRLDVLRVEFMITGTGVTNINHVAGAAGTLLSDIDPRVPGGSSNIPVALYNTTFNNGSNAPPVARFSYSPPDVLPGQLVSFDATASSDPDGTVTAYLWDFGDTTSQLFLSVPTVRHSFVNSGNYTVSLTVTDNGGATNTTTKKLTVFTNQGPVAQFTVTPSQPLVNQQVTFNATQSYDPNHFPLTYQWTFGDGSSSTAKVATYSYTQQGAYTVTLAVTNSHSVGMSTTKVVVATRISYLPGVKVGDSATFLVSGNSSQTRNLVTVTINVTKVQGTLVNYTSTLLYLNGTTIRQLNSADILTFNVLLIPADLAAGDVIVAPSGLGGATINATVTRTFAGASRFADQLMINSGGLGFTIRLSAYWDNATGLLLGLNSTLVTPQGLSTVRLSLVNTNIWTPTTNRLPIPIFTWSPVIGTARQMVSFDATRSYDPDPGDHVTTYNWQFGDGSTAAGSTASHSYSTIGNFNVTLTVTDTLGGSFSWTQSITVTVPSLIVSVTAKLASGASIPSGGTAGQAPLTIIFTAAATGGSPQYTFTWSLPGGSPSSGSGPTVSVLYSLHGTYTATLTVTDSVGLQVDGSFIVTVSTAYATLKILVTDVNKSPLQGAAVKLFLGSTGQILVGQQISGVDGTVTFGDLLPRDYSYQVSYGDYQTPVKTVNLAEAAAQSNTENLPTVQQTPPSPVNYLLYAAIGVAIIILSIGLLAFRRRKPPKRVSDQSANREDQASGTTQSTR